MLNMIQVYVKINENKLKKYIKVYKKFKFI